MAKVDSITKENCRILTAAFIEENNLKIKKVAKSIPCPEDTLNRILAGKTLPSDEMMKQIGILLALGFEKYSKLKTAEKEKISEALGAVGGGTLGFASITAVISASGVTAGLSAAGIAAGLSAIGGIVGGGMAAGVVVTAAIPIAAGAAGYALIKGIKALIASKKLDDDRIDPKWEEPLALAA
jgi:hypothetical protein